MTHLDAIISIAPHRPTVGKEYADGSPFEREVVGEYAYMEKAKGGEWLHRDAVMAVIKRADAEIEDLQKTIIRLGNEKEYADRVYRANSRSYRDEIAALRASDLRVRPATAEDVNMAFDPANEVLGGAFMAGFREGWIYAEIDADGERYQEMAEEYAMAVDTAPGEAWDAHRATFFAMLPLAAIPEMGAPIADTEAEIARVVQSINEWDDRTSPDDYPEHLLITSEELSDILRNFAATLEGK